MGPDVISLGEQHAFHLDLQLEATWNEHCRGSKLYYPQIAHSDWIS